MCMCMGVCVLCVCVGVHVSDTYACTTGIAGVHNSCITS